jgi:hypothetical protein
MLWTVKKINKNLDRDYGPVKLNSADLTEIFDALNGCSDLKLTVDDFEYDSIAEWVENSEGRIPSKVLVECYKPTVTVRLNRLYTSLSILSHDLSAHGYFNKINQVLSRCERRPKFLYKNLFWSLLMGSIWIILPQLFKRDVLTVCSILGAWLLLFLWTTYILFRRHSLVIPSAARKGTFWRRNSDDILKLAIGAIIGAVLSNASTILTERLRSNHSTMSPPAVAPQPAPAASK